MPGAGSRRARRPARRERYERGACSLRLIGHAPLLRHTACRTAVRRRKILGQRESCLHQPLRMTAHPLHPRHAERDPAPFSDREKQGSILSGNGTRPNPQVAAQYGKLGERVFRVTQTHMVRPTPRVRPHRRFTNRGADNLSESADAGLVSFKIRCAVWGVKVALAAGPPRAADGGPQGWRHGYLVLQRAHAAAGALALQPAPRTSPREVRVVALMGRRCGSRTSTRTSRSGSSAGSRATVRARPPC